MSRATTAANFRSRRIWRERVREHARRPEAVARPAAARRAIGWRLQNERSVIPGADEVLVETFPRGSRHYLVAYPFEGRLAHQTLGMLLTRRLDRVGAKPLGFVANDYALAVWALRDIAALIADGRLASTSCSTRTCWATISMRGSPKSPDEAHVPHVCASSPG